MGEKKMSYYWDMNQCNTSATDRGFGGRGSANQNNFYWSVPEKHCGGTTKCGKVCHKTKNCAIVDSFKEDGKTIYKYYCRKCKTYNEGSAEDCK